MERLHLVAILIFVVIEDMDSSGTWVPSNNILRESFKILGSEVGTRIQACCVLLYVLACILYTFVSE